MTHPEQSAEFISRLRKSATNRLCKTLIVDHRPLRRITPAAALVLLAEMYRLSVLSWKVTIQFTRPTEAQPRDLLGAIGYYDYAERNTWEGATEQQWRFWKHRRGEGVDQEAAKELVRYLPTMQRGEISRLFEALVEGMQNTSEHAYLGMKQGYRSWWLLGFSDQITGEMAFCFYDQGRGIPDTIRTRWKDRLLFLAPKGSELIRQAVVEGHYSRTKKNERGRGLPTLKRFIDDADGEMLIFSRESRCIFTSSAPPLCDDYGCHLQGTLISWTLRRHVR